MRSIIRLGNGKYYYSPLFGMYIHSPNPFKSYVVCLDEQKKLLIRYPLYNPASRPTLDLMVLFIDEDATNWIRHNEKYSGVDFLSQTDALKYTKNNSTPEDVLNRCLSYDFEEDFSVFRSVQTKKDAEQLLSLTGEFHDAYVKVLEKRPDGSLYLLFDGIWGCRAEIIFSGDVSYNLDGRNEENYVPYWFGASIFLHDGYVYLSDDVSRLEDISASECWFKARNMQYRIIPE